MLAFSLECPEIGYAQGMNFLAAMILVGVDMDEHYAFTILVHLLKRVEDEGFKLEMLFDA